MKLVIAVDEAREDLIRIVQYVNDHSDFDVRLVVISKFDNGAIFVPNILVSGSNGEEKSVVEKSPKLSPIFQSVVDTYNAMAPREAKVAERRSQKWRFIQYEGWSFGTHYEFLSYGQENALGIELHLEPQRGDEKLPPCERCSASITAS